VTYKVSLEPKQPEKITTGHIRDVGRIWKCLRSKIHAQFSLSSCKGQLLAMSTNIGYGLLKALDDFDVKSGIDRSSCWDLLLVNNSFGVLIVVSDRPSSFSMIFLLLLRPYVKQKLEIFSCTYSRTDLLKFPKSLYQISRA